MDIILWYRTPIYTLVKLAESFKTFFQSGHKDEICVPDILSNQQYLKHMVCLSLLWPFAHTAPSAWNAFSSLST